MLAEALEVIRPKDWNMAKARTAALGLPTNNLLIFGVEIFMFFKAMPTKAHASWSDYLAIETF
jgi:hypothetical protein